MNFCAMKRNILFKLSIHNYPNACGMLRGMMWERRSGSGFLKHYIYYIITFREIHLMQF